MTFEPYSKTVVSRSGKSFNLRRALDDQFNLWDGLGICCLTQDDISALYKLLGDWMAGGRGEEAEDEPEAQQPVPETCPDGKPHQLVQQALRMGFAGLICDQCGAKRPRP